MEPETARMPKLIKHIPKYSEIKSLYFLSFSVLFTETLDVPHLVLSFLQVCVTWT